MIVGYLPEAELRIEAVDAWWRENRPAARQLFREELEAAIARALVAPLAVGVVYASIKGMRVRRTLLTKTCQHLYYSVDEEADELLIHAVWGAARGRGPTL